jgi:hypothetical protein
MSIDDVQLIVQNVKQCAPLQKGLHIGGGEPFLNFELLLRTIELCIEQGIALQYAETNAGWCADDEVTTTLFKTVRDSGLPAILISVSPFHNEFIPFRYTERAVAIASDIFGAMNVLVYTDFFFRQLQKFDPDQKLAFNRYVNTIGRDQFSQDLIQYYQIIPCGRMATRLNYLYQPQPAPAFFNTNCHAEFTNPHHIHIDPYGNYIVSFCAGISLGDARDLAKLYAGIDLTERPLLEILLETGVEGLFKLAKDQFDYVEQEAGYIAKCHLCQDIRRHIISITNQFDELKPVEFYRYL